MSYKTKSLLIAAFLYSHPEIKLDDVDKTDVDNIYFSFSPEAEAEKIVDSYYTDRGLNINAKIHDESAKNLKDMIFEIRRQGGR